MVAILDYPSIAVSRIGRLVVGVLIKCEFMVPSSVKGTISFMFSSGHCFSNVLLSLCSNIGLPFYGRSFAGRGLTAFGQANDGSADVISWSEDEGSPQCKFVSLPFFINAPPQH